MKREIFARRAKSTGKSLSLSLSLSLSIFRHLASESDGSSIEKIMLLRIALSKSASIKKMYNRQ
jgi:hypothetical protein